MSREKDAKVGFGDDYSRTHATHTMNAHVHVETRPVPGGADVTITARRGHVIAPEVDADASSVTIHLRKDAGPRIGESIMVGKRHVIVTDRRFDSRGGLQVLDGDTGAWIAMER